MGGNIASKFQRITESMRNIHVLLYYVNMTTYSPFNGKLPRVPIIHFYILIWFHIRRKICSGLSLRVFYPGHPVKCTRKYCTNKPFHTLHHYIPEHSTRHRTLLHTPNILHTKTFLLRPVTCTIKYPTRQNCHILH